MATNIIDFDEQSAGGSTETLNQNSNSPQLSASAAERLAQIANGVPEKYRSNRQLHKCCYNGSDMVCNSTHSGDTSRGTSSDTSNRTRVMPTPFYFHADYNSGAEQDDSDDDLEELFSKSRTTVAIQTEYNEDFPPLSSLTARKVASNQQQDKKGISMSSNANQNDVASGSTTTEGTLQLVIQNFRHMTDTIRGPSKYIQNVPWRIMVMPRQHVVQKKGTQKCLGFFLQCCPDAYSDSWLCQASAELRLISQKMGVPNFTRKTSHVYTSKENDWGYSCFMTWADILDENQGYIKEDKVVLEIHVKADPPKNILTHKEFQKKILEYKRLADLQCQRGLIDKAIECNTQALKFCKDRDPQCKNDLEAQKSQLIEMKLKQSIQRIEKGNDPKSEDDTAANLNALRHALGTATKTSSKIQTQAQKSKPKDTVNTINSDLSKLNQRAKTPPFEKNISLPKTPPPTEKKGSDPGIQYKSKSEKSLTTITDPEISNNEKMKIASTKDLVALGHFNKSLLNSTEFDNLMGVRCHDEDEELLPSQIHHYLEHLSEKDKEIPRLERFSSEVDHVAMRFDYPEEDEVIKELLEMHQTEGRRRRHVRQICECCLQEAVKRETLESGCQTEFARSDALDFVHPVDKPTKEAWSTNAINSANKTTNTTTPIPTLPVRRKKALAKKSQIPSQQQQRTNEKWQTPLVTPKANPRSQNFTAADFAAAFNPSSEGIPSADMLTATIDTKQPLGGLIDPSTIQAGMDINLIDMAAMSNEIEPGYFGKCIDNPNMDMAGQQALASHYNMCSRQYIEEWLRQNAPNLQVNYDTDGTPLSISNFPPHFEELIQQHKSGLVQNSNATVPKSDDNETAAALSIIGLNCMISRNIQQRVFEFFDALESHPNFRDLRASIDRLLTLSGDVGNKQTKDSTSTTESQENDFNALQRNFFEENSQDFTLIRDFRQIELLLSTKMNTILSYFHNTSINDVIIKIETRIKLLEENFRSTKLNYEASKSNETLIGKQFLESQKSLHAMTEKYERVSQQLKDKKNEIKKLEKKAKSEAQLATDNADLQEKVETLKKELAQSQRQLSEEQARYKRDTQSLADSKKHLNAELNAKYAEIQKLNNQLEEKSQLLKKNESYLANERKNNSEKVASLNDRSKKAEIALLEQRLEDGLRILERAKDDCGLQIKQLDELQKRTNISAELDVIKKNISEWESKREEVVSLINQSKVEFSTHINSIRSGKQLSQIPKIQVPKPPPCPKLYPMPQPPNQQTPGRTSPHQHSQQLPLSIDRKVITPPNARISSKSANDPSTPQIPPLQQFNASGSSVSPGSTSYGSHSIPGSANITPVKAHQMPLSMNNTPMQSNVMSNIPQQLGGPSLAPIGVRPYNYQNGVIPSKQGFSAFSSMHQLQARQSPPAAYPQSQHQQQFAPPSHQNQSSSMHQPHVQQICNGYPSQQPQTMPQQTQIATTNISGASSGLWGGWGDQLNNISELFGHGRSFGPLGSEFGSRNENSGSNLISSASRSSVPTVLGVGGSTTSVIGSGRNLQNTSPSAQLASAAAQQHNSSNGWSSFNDTTWNASLGNASIAGRPS